MIANLKDNCCVSDVITHAGDVHTARLAFGVNLGEHNPEVADWVVGRGYEKGISRLQESFSYRQSSTCSKDFVDMLAGVKIPQYCFDLFRRLLAEVQDVTVANANPAAMWVFPFRQLVSLVHDLPPA